MYAYNSQVHRSENTRPIDLVLTWRIPDLKLKSTASTGKTYTAAKQLSGFLATIEHSLDRARISLQRTQERTKRDFNRHLCNGREMTESSYYLLSDLLDGVAETLKLGNAVEGPYQVLAQNQHTVVNQR